MPADRLPGVIKRLASVLPVRVLRRFVSIDGKTRMVVLASQAFTALVPLLLVIASIGANPDEDNRLANNLIRRFRLDGQAATAVHTLFSRPPDAAGGVGILGAVLLLFSVLSLAKTLQVTFETAWGISPGGFRRTLYGVSGLSLLVADLATLALLAASMRGIPGGSATSLLVRITESVLVWLILQYLLLSRQVPWRRLVPGAALAGAGQLIISVYSAIYMPNLIATNSSRYGIIGVTLALITWLMVVAGAIVAGAAAGAELGGRPQLLTRYE
jgi:membrane protein